MSESMSESVEQRGRYVSALVKDGVVIGGMLHHPEHPAHAPHLAPETTGPIEAAIEKLPHDGQVHLVEYYEAGHAQVGAVHPETRELFRPGLYVNNEFAAE